MNSDPLHDFVPSLPPVDTSRPCPISGDYLAVLTECEPVYGKTEGSEDTNKKMWKMTWELCSEAESVPGEDGSTRIIPPGFQVIEYALLYKPEPKPGKKEFDHAQALAVRYDAIMGTTNATRPENYADLRVGKGRKAVLNLKPENDPQYGWRANIAKHKAAPAGA